MQTDPAWRWEDAPSDLYPGQQKLFGPDGAHLATVWRMASKPGWTGHLTNGARPQRGTLEEVKKELESAARQP